MNRQNSLIFFSSSIGSILKVFRSIPAKTGILPQKKELNLKVAINKKGVVTTLSPGLKLHTLRELYEAMLLHLQYRILSHSTT
jgi:hypothetical protein